MTGKRTKLASFHFCRNPPAHFIVFSINVAPEYSIIVFSHRTFMDDSHREYTGTIIAWRVAEE